MIPENKEYYKFVGIEVVSVSSVWYYDRETGDEVKVFTDPHYSVFAELHISAEDIVFEICADYGSSCFYGYEEERGVTVICEEAQQMRYLGTAVIAR